MTRIGEHGLNCEFHPNVKAIALCTACNTPVCGICARYSGDTVLCERCEDKSSLSTFVDTQQKKQNEGMGELLSQVETRLETSGSSQVEIDRTPDRKEKIHMAVVIVSCVFIAFQIYRSLGSGAILTENQILAQENTRNQIESCMLVFWEIAGQLESGQEPDDSLACAEAGAPMQIARVGDDIRVSHPRPDLLGFTDIYVTRSNPVPIMVE